MALTGALGTHVTSILNAVSAAMGAKTNAQVLYSEPAQNVKAVIEREVAIAVAAENWADLLS